MYIATAAWLCLLLGVLRRRHRYTHVPLVLTGIVTDYSLVVFLQITRQAVQTALSFKLSLWQQTHILLSSIALLLYLPVVFFGIALLIGYQEKKVRVFHRRFALWALFFRTLGFIFMFSMYKH